VRTRLLFAAVLAALLLPGGAAAHSGGAIVALDYRLRLDTPAIGGVRAKILDGDQALRLTIAGGENMIVLGYLREPMLRIDPSGVWVNTASPTAAAAKIIGRQGKGWRRLGGGSSFSWHDHRLAPPPLGTIGLVGRFSIPIRVDGRPARIGGTFWRVARPSPWPWLGGAVALTAALATAARLWRRWRERLTLTLGAVAGLAAVAVVAAFAAPDAPEGRIAWLEVGAATAYGAALVGMFVVLRGRERVLTAGILGAIALAANLSSLPVYWHGVVISFLPATSVRVATALAIVGGGGAAALSFLRQFDDRVPARPHLSTSPGAGSASPSR
jgi:hypothetical protein